MSRAVTRTWYRVALARSGAAPVLVAASGEHLGAAIAAAEHHVEGAWAVAAELASEGQVPLGESVGKHLVVTLDEAPSGDALPALRWPSGVLPQLGRTEALGGARRGYTVHPGGALLVVEAQTDADHLIDLYLGLLERLPAADNLEVRVLDHFEDTGRTDVWLTSRVDAKKILRFLDDHDVELIGNGHVELSIYVRKLRATLRLTEHKTVVWLAEGRALEAELAGWMRELGVSKLPSLVTIAAAPHFHYRPAKSRDRKKLAEELYRQRLRRVDTVEAGRAPESGARGVRDTAG